MNPILTLAISLMILILGANLMIIGLKRLASRFHLSNLFVGLTLAAVATSIPEIANSIFSAINGAGNVALGNIIGANINNLTYGIGILIFLTPVVLKEKMLKTDAIFLVIAILALFLAISDGMITPFEGLILMVIYFVYVSQLLKAQKITKEKLILDAKKDTHGLWTLIPLLLLGTGLVIVSSNLVVKSVVQTAEIIGLSEYLISLLMIAVATTIPELTVTIVSYFRKATAIGVGNLVGSNIANPLFGLGLGAMFGGLRGEQGIILVDLLFLLFITLFFIFIAYSVKKTNRKHSYFFFAIYILYLIWKLQAVL